MFSPGEIWHPSVLRFSLREGSAPERGASSARVRGSLYCDLWKRRGKVAPLAQFSLRGSKRMDYQFAQVRDASLLASAGKGAAHFLGFGRLCVACSQEWVLGGKALTEAGVCASSQGLRQLPCCSLVADLSSDEGAEGLTVGATDLWKNAWLREHEAVQLFHELGHCTHALLSNTETQHLSGTKKLQTTNESSLCCVCSPHRRSSSAAFSGTRGAVDFTEFPSHLFELAGKTLLQRNSERETAASATASPLGALSLCQQLSLALLDRVKQSCFTGASIRGRRAAARVASESVFCAGAARV